MEFDFVDVLGIPYVHIPFVRLRQLASRWRWGITIWEAWWDYSYHSGLLGPLSRHAFRVLLNTGLHGSHKVIVGSRHTREALSAHYHVPTSRIAMVQPGTDLSHIGRLSPWNREVDIAFLGRLDWYKRVGDILVAMRLLKERHLALTASIIGDGAEMLHLRRQAQSLGLSNDVAFHGRLSKDEVYKRLKAAKVFVLPSEREGFSIATLEAMACGAVPIVAEPDFREAFGVSDLVLDGHSGLVYPVGQSRELAIRIEWLLQNDDQRARMALAARHLAEQYDWTRAVSAYESQVLELRANKADDSAISSA